MSEAPPQLADIPQYSEMNIPTLSSAADQNQSAAVSTSNGSKIFQDTKESIYSSGSSRDTVETSDFSALDAQTTANTISDHPLTQNVKEVVKNGPVADTVKYQTAKTASEFNKLTKSRTTTSTSTITGQPLTHYHSFFYDLLSWEHPRATALSFLTTILFIFGTRYLPALRWSFKILSYALGVTLSTEIAGKLVLSQGIASSMRPKKYYTIPRESLEASLEDVEQLVNFFVIEFQRVLFAENIFHTTVAFVSALMSYWLVKYLPLWGLSLIAVSIIYLAPLIYVNNRELIDERLNNVSNIINSQAEQVKDLAGHHASRASETVKTYAGDYTAKAQEYIGSVRGRSTSAEVSGNPMVNAPVVSEPGAPPSYNSSDFPHAPKQEPVPGVVPHKEQYEKSQFGGHAEATT